MPTTLTPNERSWMAPALETSINNCKQQIPLPTALGTRPAAWTALRGSPPALKGDFGPSLPSCLSLWQNFSFSQPFPIHVSYPDSPEYSIFFGWLHGHLAGFSNHVSSFLQAICQISELIAAAFRGEYQLSRPVDLIFMLQRTKAKPEFYRVEARKWLRD